MRVSTPVSATAAESTGGSVSDDELVCFDGPDVGKAALVVLQAAPVDGAASPLGVLGPGYRSLARQALDAGSDAVLVVPALPEAAASEVVRATWSRFATRRRPPPLLTLLALVARTKVLAGRDKSSAGGDHAVFDVLLFVRVPAAR
jgi:hypothetical protein